MHSAPRAHHLSMGTLRLVSLPISGHGSESLGYDQRSRPFGWTGSALPILRVECQHDLEPDHGIRQVTREILVYRVKSSCYT